MWHIGPISLGPERSRDLSVKGRVKLWNVRRGWGFIVAEDGVQYFAHHSGIKTNQSYKLLVDNQTVEFDPVNTEKGPKAINIRPADCVSEEAYSANNNK